MELKQSLSVLEPAIWQCWSQIASDVFECAQACGCRVSNREAIEACLDADRLLLVCNLTEAHALFKSVVQLHGWEKTARFFARHIKLV